MVIYVMSAFLVYFVRHLRMHLFMGLSFLVMLTAFTFMNVYINKPNVFIILAYNFMYLLSSMLIIVGFRDYFKVKALPGRYWFYLLVSVIGTAYFTQMIPSYIGRVSINTFFMTLFTVDALLEVRPVIMTVKPKVRKTVYIIAVCLLTFFVSRPLYVILVSNPSDTLAQNMATTAITTGFFSIVTFNFWITASVLLESHQVVQDLKQKSSAMEHLAMVDPLTQLMNRNRMETDMAAMVDSGNRDGAIASVLLIDLDYFKHINDRFGHDVGDQILMMAANAIKGLLRSDDRVYRWGGDEFLILTPYTDLIGAQRLAQRLLDRFAELTFPSVEKVTLSIGCAQHFRYETKTDLFKRVDLALYKAKQSGRNRVESWSNDEMLPASITKLVWSDAFKSGHGEIDRQHRNLIRLSNELYDVLGSPDSGANLDEILNRVATDLSEHFTYEANLMVETGYQGAEDHRLAHESLLSEFVSMREELRQGRVNLGAFFNFVSVRIVAEHIIKDDSKFFAHLKSL